MDKMQEKVYVDVMLESLEQKQKIMHNILSLTKDQTEILTEESPDAEELDRIFNIKGMYVEQLQKIDEGFQAVYEKVKEEIQQNKYQHRPKIEQMQVLIKEITETGVSIQAQEEQNRERFEQYFAGEKKEIKSFKVSNKTAASYYKNMANQPINGQSYLFNSKK